jgi:hypothetical protein
MIAAVTDLSGTITGAHRTWLDPSGQDTGQSAEGRKRFFFEKKGGARPAGTKKLLIVWAEPIRKGRSQNR